MATNEEENYIRIALLLTGISPRAVRHYFDTEFHPSCLEQTIRLGRNTLMDLKSRRVITNRQWDLLFPTVGYPNSTNFDVTLMTTLLKNLASIPVPDQLPVATDTSHGAALGRIKYFRNQLAHLNDSKIDNGQYEIMWNSLAEAVKVLGDVTMHEETTELRTKVLDRSNKEIMLEIKQAYEEIKELRQAVTDISTEQESLKVQHQALQQDHMSLAAKVTDPVPWNIREIFNSQLQTWRKEDKIFVTTSTVKKILKCCKENFCVTITANSGIGKTMILRHVGLIMAEEGYDVIPVDDPGDIKRYYNPKKKTLFVVDDFCGKYAADRNQVSRWETLSNNYRYIEKNTKIIVSCRLQVYQDILFSVLSLFKSCVCDISSKDFNPSKKELRSIAAVYLKENVDKIDDSAYSFDCFPLLCKLYSDNPSLGLEFFQQPFTVYENELNQMCVRQEAEKYCALALCVVFNNCVEVKLLTDEIGPDLRSVFGNIFEACKLNRETSRLLIRDSLDVLVNTYIMKEGDVYKTIHDKLFDFLSFYFGKKILTVLIKNADIKWIGERLLLDEYKFGSEPEFTVIAPQEYLLLLDNRLKSEWLNGHIERVFLSVNMKNPKFREHFLQYIESGETLEQSTLAKTIDISTNINMLMIFAFYGDKQWAEWCFKFGINVNMSDANGASPLHAACWSGNNNTEMVQMLLEKKANINQCTTDNGSTPLLICCLYGHTEICQILIDKNADVNQCTTDNFTTPLYLACQSGHTDIVQKLIENKADINKCSSGEGATPLYIACHQGRAEIVKMLLKNKANINQCTQEHGIAPLDTPGQSTEIDQLIVDNKADKKHSPTDTNKLSLYAACHTSHTDIGKTKGYKAKLMNCMANIGFTPLHIACQKGHTEIVKTLLKNKANINQRTKNGETPLDLARQNGHTEIAQLLSDNKAEKSSSMTLFLFDSSF